MTTDLVVVGFSYILGR